MSPIEQPWLDYHPDREHICRWCNHYRLANPSLPDSRRAFCLLWKQFFPKNLSRPPGKRMCKFWTEKETDEMFIPLEKAKEMENVQ